MSVPSTIMSPALQRLLGGIPPGMMQMGAPSAEITPGIPIPQAPMPAKPPMFGSPLEHPIYGQLNRDLDAWIRGHVPAPGDIWSFLTGGGGGEPTPTAPTATAAAPSPTPQAAPQQVTTPPVAAGSSVPPVPSAFDPALDTIMEGMGQGTAQTAEAQPQGSFFDNLIGNDNNLAMLRMAMSLLQPIPAGQSSVGHLAQAGAGGLDYLIALQAQRRKEGRESERLGLESKKVGILERGETREGAKERSEAELRAARAREAEAKAGLFERSSGRNTGKTPKTAQDFMTQWASKLATESAYMTPQDANQAWNLGLTMARQLYPNWDGKLAGGVPGPTAAPPGTAAQEAGKPAVPKTAIQEWPKTSGEAITAIKEANKGNPIDPWDLMMLDFALRRRYKDYKMGQIKEAVKEKE